jgi:hypothetical protein
MVLLPGTGRDLFLEHWDVAIYRAFYEPGYEKIGDNLQTNIMLGVRYKLSRLDGAEKDPSSTS